MNKVEKYYFLFKTAKSYARGSDEFNSIDQELSKLIASMSVEELILLSGKIVQ